MNRAKLLELKRELHQGDHKHLLKIFKKDSRDYAPWGKVEYEFGDCSCGCKFYVELEWPLGADWGVCCNPRSHRVGLLTFEHQGCPQYKPDPE